MRRRLFGGAIPPSLATAVGISVASHLAVYGLTPVLSLHLVTLGGTSAQVGLLFSVFSLVAVMLRPVAGRGSIVTASGGPCSPAPSSWCRPRWGSTRSGGRRH